MIPIGPHTKISALIKANEKSIDAIASLAKPLQKLKNPLLRRIMASRVTIAEAASIGGCTVADFKRVLEPLGFELNSREDHSQDDILAKPAWLSDDIPCTTLDVRQTIADGHDPLKEINQSYHQLAHGHILCIVNTFIPYPLIKLLEGKGAKTFVETINEQEYRTYFLKETVSAPSRSSSGISTLELSDFEAILDPYADKDIICLDVRKLPMPQPMETILETLPSIGAGQILFVYHKRVPLHLLEEMEEYDYKIHICEVAEGDVRLLIYRS